LIHILFSIALLAETRIDPPAREQSGMAFLERGPAGEVYLSWTESEAGMNTLRFAEWKGSAWSPAETIATGKNWFVNWADFPAIAAHPDGSLYAHWLPRPDGAQKWGYGIRIARRDVKTGKWRESTDLNTKNIVTYAGFLSFITAGPIAGAVYLGPPPGEKPHDHGHDAESSYKTVRFAAFKPDGSLLSDREIDGDACSCCQTAVAATDKGLIVAYRDHLPGEIRDIAVTRFSDGAWTQPRTLYADGWKINGCPTDGPSITASRSQAAIAWLTRANGIAKVQASFSSDSGETFRKPVRIDDGNPLGRASIVGFDDASYLAVWLEKLSAPLGHVEVRVRRIFRDGRILPARMVASGMGGRAMGFPKIVISGERVFIAWRDDRVRVSLLSKSDFMPRQDEPR